MIELRHSIEVKAAPAEVFEWLTQRMRDKESYQEWHPDHVDIRWIKGEPLQEGSIVYAEEHLHGRLHKLKFRFTRVVPNKLIEYRCLFPGRPIAPGNSFVIEPKGDNSCVFTAGGSIRIPRWLFVRVHENHKHKIEAVEKHMREEGENLKKAAEEKEHQT